VRVKHTMTPPPLEDGRNRGVGERTRFQQQDDRRLVQQGTAFFRNASRGKEPNDPTQLENEGSPRNRPIRKGRIQKQASMPKNPRDQGKEGNRGYGGEMPWSPLTAPRGGQVSSKPEVLIAGGSITNQFSKRKRRLRPQRNGGIR